MILKDWDVWFNYSMYFLNDVEDIQSFARSLVEFGLCKVVYDSNGFIYWQKESEVIHQKLKRYQKSSKSEISLTFPKELKHYPLEGAYQAAKMNFFEELVFNSRFLEQILYIRGFLGPCYFKLKDRLIALYPQIKLYNNGVFILSYRMISHSSPYPLSDLIENELVLFKHNPDTIDVPPEWVSLDTKAMTLLPFKSSFTRFGAWKFILYTQQLIAKNKKIINENDFNFEIFPLDLIKNDSNNLMDLGELTSMITSSLSYIINNKRESLKYIIYGQRNNVNIIGNFWYGQPSIYILNFSKQPIFSKQVVKKYIKEINQLKIGTTYGKIKNQNSILGQDLRLFDDYSIFMDYGNILFIFGKSGLKSNREYKDPNRGHLIYDKQILVEAINYLYMSHMRQIERSSMLNISIEELIKEKQRILELEELTKKIGNFGEIDDLFNYASEIFELKALREKSEKNLELRSQAIRERRDRSFKNFGLLISILFGLLGVFPLTDKVLKPIWKYFNWWTPNNSLLKELFFYITPLLTFLVIIIVLWKLIFHGRKE